MTVERMWEVLETEYGVSDETLRIITDINGYSEETMRDVLYAVAAEHEFEEENDEEN